MRISQWTDKLKRLGALEWAQRYLLLRAAGWLAIARLMLVVLPFSRLMSNLTGDETSECFEADPALVSSVAWAVAVAANHVPWRSDCFPQSIAARMLLRRYDYESTIHIGVERSGESEIAGHAWLTCNGVVVTGGNDLDRYTEVHTLTA